MADSVFKDLFKRAASSRLAQHQKTRSGKRPIRVHNLLKKQSSTSGADLRLPVMGGTKFPTNDSLTQSKQLLKETQDVARPKMVRPTLHSVLPDYSKMSSVKEGQRMNIADDPLVQYLKKQAAETPDPPMAPKANAEGQIDTNKDEMKTSPEEQGYADETDTGVNRYKETKNSDWKDYMTNVFQNVSGIKPKYTDKESEEENIVTKTLRDWDPEAAINK